MSRTPNPDDETQPCACGRCVEARKLHARRMCIVCAQRPVDDYMVTPDVWRAAGFAYRGFACLACLQHALGRPLELHDFTPAPVNNAIRFAYAMAQRSFNIR